LDDITPKGIEKRIETLIVASFVFLHHSSADV